MKLKSASKKTEKTQNRLSGEEQKQCCCSSGATAQASSITKEDQVRQKAYELYEKRGCQVGRDQEDWFEAEKSICKQN